MAFENHQSGTLTVRNIGELVVVPRGPIGGRAMGSVPRIPHAAVRVEDGKIIWFGPEAAFNGSRDGAVLDAQGGCVIPGLIDCHTHTVFAGSREQEFVQRIQGKTYAQIAKEGGGIVSTVEAVRRATSDALLALAIPRLERMLHHGVTTVEIKSGYGLSVEDELKMLYAIRCLGSNPACGTGLQPVIPSDEHLSQTPVTNRCHTGVEVVATYLAAHTTPREFAGRPNDYLDAVLSDSVLARIRDEKLAEFCDVFCETTAFDLTQSRRVLNAAHRFGLYSKIHADQIAQMGASRLAGEVGAVSADHLEHIDDDGIEALKKAGTIAVLLPGCSFFLGVPQAPARKLLEADLPVAVATDYNPGSSMIESLPLVLSIACTQMRMTPTEALVATTANAAAALRRNDRLGAIEIGMQADLVVLDVPNLDRWLYEPGRNCVSTVIKAGSPVIPQNPSRVL